MLVTLKYMLNFCAAFTVLRLLSVFLWEPTYL